jgi:ribonuclease P protein component
MEVLFASGATKQSYPLKLVFCKPDIQRKEPVQAMFVVPKRKFKKASDRNTLRRRMKEAYRLSKSELYLKLGDKTLDIAFLYTGSREESYQVIEAAIRKLLSFLTEEKKQKSA